MISFEDKSTLIGGKEKDYVTSSAKISPVAFVTNHHNEITHQLDTNRQKCCYTFNLTKYLINRPYRKENVNCKSLISGKYIYKTGFRRASYKWVLNPTIKGAGQVIGSCLLCRHNFENKRSPIS